MQTDIQQKINRMAEIKRQQEALKAEWAKLEGFFLKQCQDDLADTKRKTVAYSSAKGKLTATLAQKINITYQSYLKRIFGEAYADAVTETVKCKLSAPASRMLAGIWTGGYSRMTRDEIISQLPCDDKTRQTLRKKLKGANYDTDRKNLMNIGGFDETSAEQYAYFIAEAVIWENFLQLMKVNDRENAEAIHEVIALIDGAIVVEQTPKVEFELLGE